MSLLANIGTISSDFKNFANNTQFLNSIQQRSRHGAIQQVFRCSFLMREASIAMNAKRNELATSTGNTSIYCPQSGNMPTLRNISAIIFETQRIVNASAISSVVQISSFDIGRQLLATMSPKQDLISRRAPFPM